MFVRGRGQLELDSVMSVPLLDSVFLYDDDEPEDADPFSARVGMLVLKGILTVASSEKLVHVIGIDLLEYTAVIFELAGGTGMDGSGDRPHRRGSRPAGTAPAARAMLRSAGSRKDAAACAVAPAVASAMGHVRNRDDATGRRGLDVRRGGN